MKKLFVIALFLLACFGGVYVYCCYSNYSNERAVAYLEVHANKKSVGRCAQYVREAIKEGGCPTWGGPKSACEYDVFLPKLGFYQVANEDYKVRKGDIVVFDKQPGHVYGHIAMWNGKQWISDFKQKSIIVNICYNNQSRTYWRRDDGVYWRTLW